MFSSHIWNKANAEKGRFYRYISNINTWKKELSFYLKKEQKMKSINQKKIEIIKRLIELNKQLDELTRYY